MIIFQVSSRKSYKHEDMEDEEETVVLFSREGEGSHDLDWAQIFAPLVAWTPLLAIKTHEWLWLSSTLAPLMALLN